MNQSLEQMASAWVESETPFAVADDYYCETRDIFQARLDKLVSTWLAANSGVPENDIYILSAIAGEIGNNSFDHNLGNWPDMPGIFFGYELNDDKLMIVLADRGQGVLSSLKRVKPDLETDAAALEIAFNEKISGRAPEPRGNGLKFVKENIKTSHEHLRFRSGTAEAILNATMAINPATKIHGCLAVITHQTKV